MSIFSDMAAACKDAFVILNHSVRIEYRDGDFWAIDDEHQEHPLVARLRVASMASLTTDPPEVEIHTADNELVDRLREERLANDRMRTFLVDLEEICRKKGMPGEVMGRNVLAWLRDHVT